MDVYPAQAAQEVTFLHVLIPADQTDEKPPAVRSREDGQIQTVELNLKGQQVQVHVDVRNMTVQQISFRNGSGQLLFEKRLAREVTANLPIPGAGGAIFR
jgi:hypothetical protein